jgi:imidazole glycerol-phosphate synthase subunit HisF
MTRIRVIPVLLLAHHGMVKTQRFARSRYLGDPINAVKIFNEKMADELILLDIEATAKGRVDFDWVEDIVSEAFMPIAYGGGINSIVQCEQLFKRGVEKIVVNTAGCVRPQLIAELAERFGSQSVVVSIDARQNLWKRSKVYIKGGRKQTKFSPVELARKSEELGAGEIFLTSIKREGTFGGYDIELLHSVCSTVRVPVIANGGAGSIEDFERAVALGGCSAVAAGSMFVFAAKGEGVLINYPSESELQEHLWSRLR